MRIAELTWEDTRTPGCTLLTTPRIVLPTGQLVRLHRYAQDETIMLWSEILRLPGRMHRLRGDWKHTWGLDALDIQCRLVGAEWDPYKGQFPNPSRSLGRCHNYYGWMQTTACT